jgi:Bifunctional DNA primase/polymerase, N-terminal
MNNELASAWQRRWKIFPLIHRSRFAIEQPLLAQATTCAEQIRRWQRDYPDCDWAVATGKHSDVFALQLSLDWGINTMRVRFGEQIHALDTLQVQAPNRLIVFFRWPVDGFPVCISNLIATGIHIFETGSYIALPAANNVRDIRYEYRNPDASVVPAPLWLLDFIRFSLVEQRKQQTTSHSRPTTPTVSILLTFTRKDGHWLCDFYDPDSRKKISKTLSFRSDDKLIALVKRGGADMNREHETKLYGGIEKGQGAILLNLRLDQYEKLIAA